MSGYTAWFVPTVDERRQAESRCTTGRPSAACDELDHIVPLALGGYRVHRDLQQPQPWPRVRRRIAEEEAKLQAPFARPGSLGEAQTAIAADWEGAYHRYASVPCHRGKHPTIQRAERPSAASHQNPAGAWIARVKHWLTSSGLATYAWVDLI